MSTNTRKFQSVNRRPHTSFDANLAFARIVRGYADPRGLDRDVVKNILRWQVSQHSKTRTNSPVAAKKDYTYGLSPYQLAGPSARLALKVEKGTRAGSPHAPVAESVKWQHVRQVGTVLCDAKDARLLE